MAKPRRAFRRPPGSTTDPTATLPPGFTKQQTHGSFHKEASNSCLNTDRNCFGSGGAAALLPLVVTALTAKLCLLAARAERSSCLPTPLPPPKGSLTPTQRVSYYEAESFSWYSLDLLKQACTPASRHSRLITPASSAVITPSSALPANTNSWRASSCREGGGGEKGNQN